MDGSMFLPEFDHEFAETRRALERVPEEKFDWKPHEKSMSLGELVSHIAEMASWHGSLLEDVFDFDAMMADYKPYSAGDRAELLAAFDSNAAAFTQAITGKDDTFMTAEWKGIVGGEERMKGARHKMMRDFVLDHLYHHRGQLTVYLRLLDVAVPPTFGPTADFPDFVS